MSKSKIEIKQKRIGFLRRHLSVIGNGVLNIVRQSPVEECEWQIDLSIVNPESKSIRSFSRFWLSLLMGSSIGMIVVLLAFTINHHYFKSVTDFAEYLFIYAAGFMSSLIFYLRSKCEHTTFYYDTDSSSFAFSLYTDKPNPETFNQFVKDLQSEIRIARVNAKKKDIEQINSAIELLHKDRVISGHVNSLLHARLEDMSYFSYE